MVVHIYLKEPDSSGRFAPTSAATDDPLLRRFEKATDLRLGNGVLQVLFNSGNVRHSLAWPLTQVAYYRTEDFLL